MNAQKSWHLQSFLLKLGEPLQSSLRLFWVTGSIKVKDTNKFVKMEEAYAKTKLDDEYMPSALVLTLRPTFKRKLSERNNNQSFCNCVIVFCKQSKPNKIVGWWEHFGLNNAFFFSNVELHQRFMFAPYCYYKIAFRFLVWGLFMIAN